MNNISGSSDDQRAARPLKYAKSVVIPGPICLQRRATLSTVTVAYETYGCLAEDGSNAILICHALSGDSHVARHDERDDPGWWDLIVGRAKAIDTERYFVVCSNVLGGCSGTTGPRSIDPSTGEPYGASFPVVTVEDMVDIQQLLMRNLGIRHWHTVVGASLGGLQTLCWGTRYPELVKRAIVIASGPHLTAQALAFDVVGRNAILRDPDFHGGQYHERSTEPSVGLAIARMLGHITYLSPESMNAKFMANKNSPRDIETEFEKQFSVGSYLAYQGDRFVERFDANSYLKLSFAMDLFDLSQGDLESSFARSQCRWLILSFSTDWLFPPAQSRQMTEALLKIRRPVSLANIEADGGHDAFLLPEALDRYGGMIEAFIAPPARITSHSLPPAGSVLASAKLDIQRFCQLIEPHESVLDLGCGDGRVLAALAAHGCSDLVGVELDEYHVLTCLQRGFDVVHADLNEGLPTFGDERFDVVLLSETLQSLVRIEEVVREVLRVGKRAIVSFPNFGHRAIRENLMRLGRSPRTSSGPLSHPWYSSPNRRYFSLADWEEFCAERDLQIDASIYLDTETGADVNENPNLNSDLVITTIRKRS